MRKFATAAGLAACVVGVFGCSGYGTSSGTPAAPSSAPPDAIVIDIVGNHGALSFSPNPETIPPGRVVVWHNVDTTLHHVVLNDGELDTGNIGPGAFSEPMGIVAPGPYHCSIHPTMIGAIDR
jgi:plastocyanin